MKSFKFLAVFLILSLVISIPLAFGQRELPPKELFQRDRGGLGSGGWGLDSPFQRMYDPTKLVTISGKVESVSRVIPMKGMGSGIHILLKTEKETFSVHLGPAWYIERQDIKVVAGDSIEVTGSKVTIEGLPAIIAAEVKKGENILILRDSAGYPVWAGWRRR